MLGLSPKLPITEEERLWVDEGFRRLEKMLGRRRMLEAKVVLPCAEDFPDRYDKSAATAELLFRRMCAYMRVDRGTVELEIFPDETQELRDMLPYWRGNSSGCAGFYTHDDVEANGQDQRHMIVALRSTQLEDPMSLVATMAHELGHVTLLGGGRMKPTAPDHEPMTDLLTVFLGLGIFTANSAARFQQKQEERRYSWSMQRLGYLAEEVYGYALAKFASGRQEQKPEWRKYLSTNVQAYFKSLLAWLVQNPGYIAMPKQIG